MAKFCVIGSGAGAGPIIFELANAGHEVVVLEKGPWIKREHFTKDEMVATLRDVYIPNLQDEGHVLEKKKDGEWEAKSSFQTGLEFWNGSAVGGSSNFMSGYFHRMKPKDFRLLSEYGEQENANMADWPISYEELEPYYAKTEKVVGVSGKVVPHKNLEPRSTEDYPFPPLGENVVSTLLEEACQGLGYEMFPVARGILSRGVKGRQACYYSNFCGSFGCSSNAKSSARAALIQYAAELDNCQIIPHAKVHHLETNGKGELVRAWYYNKENEKIAIEADVFVVACQAIESSRLLLQSKNEEFPNGLANNSGQVGKNLLFSGGGAGSGNLVFEDFDPKVVEKLRMPGLFVNRALHDWYEIDDPEFGSPSKGGTIDFLWEHANPMPVLIRNKWRNGKILFGQELKDQLKWHFTEQRRLRFELFVDWLPNDDCFVELAEDVTDKWGDPVAHVRLGLHEQNTKVAKFLAQKGVKVMEELGARNIKWATSKSPGSNLQAGGCRFGNDPNSSVLDKNCKAHEVSNLYVTDGSFMPTGGSVPYTLTIYANSFRVADHLKSKYA